MSVIHYFIPALRLVVKVTPTPVDDIAVEIVNAAVAPQKDEAGHDPGDEQPGK